MKLSQATVSRKGQFTLFVIIGLIIISSVAFFYFFVREDGISFFSEDIEFEKDEYDMKEDAQICVSFYLKEALQKIELQGGYTTLERQEKVTTENGEIGFLYMDGEQQQELSDIEREMEVYVEDKLGEKCFAELEYTNEETGEIEVSIDIAEDEIEAKVDWPIHFIDKQDPEKSFDIKKVQVELTSNFGILFETAEVLLDHPLEEEYTLHYFTIKELDVGVFPIDNTAVYMLQKEGEYFIFVVEK